MQSEGPNKLAIVDDDPVNFDIVRDLLDGQADFEVAGCAKNIKTFQALVTKGLPDIALLDISIESGSDGLQLLNWLKEKYPNIKSIMMTASVDEIYHCYESGAQGYIVKGNWEEFLSTLQKVSAGETVVPGIVAKHLVKQIVSREKTHALQKELEEFTKREIELLTHLANNVPRQKLIAKMDITLFTFKRHVQNIRSKKNNLSIDAIVDSVRAVL